MAEAGHRGEVDVVREGLNASEPDVRRVALGAASRLNLLDSSTIVSALDDAVTMVRVRAAEVVAEMAATARPDDDADPQSPDAPGMDAAVVDALVRQLDHPACAEAAAFALGEIGAAAPEAVQALQHQASQHDDALCREAAVAALGTLGAGRDIVIQAMGDVATVRRRAVVALAAFDGDEVDAALQAALNDRDWQVRQVAEDLVAIGDE